MQPVYVLEHAVLHEGSHIVDLYETWEALLYGVSQHYPAVDEGADQPSAEKVEALLTGQEASAGMPKEWTTPNFGCGDDEWLRVTERPVRTATKDRFEVRVRSLVLGEVYDRVIRDSDGISDEGHATGLAAGWNQNPPFGMEGDAEFYVKRLD